MIDARITDQGGEPQLEGCHPAIADWFREKFGLPTDIQRRTWKPVSAGEHVLLAAPTGSGKTLAALLPCLNGIARRKEEQPEQAAAGVRLLYVTPLKALNNDIHEHLLGFVRELEPYGQQYARTTGGTWSGISAGVRTGDTTQSTRASMLRNPPDVLVTTPESLFLLLASQKARQTLRTVEQVIVDEIHDLAADKRGMHLTVSLERLEALCGRPVQRIGVSATINPMERIARYLGGWTEQPTTPEPETGEIEAGAEEGLTALGVGHAGKAGAPLTPRPVTIVESPMAKTFDVTVTMPEIAGAGGKRSELWTIIAGRLIELMEGSRSVLIFVNNRRLCERVTLHLNDYTGTETARSHHGSVSRERRLETERALKDGSLRCLVATSSLELGIDVGHVDLVIQIDSPQSAASGIQRIGRAGHSVGDVSRGIIVVRHRGQLAECAVLAKEIAARRVEPIEIPAGSIDVFCQQTAAMVAERDWLLDELLALIGRSDSFREVSRERLLDMLNVLAGYYPHCRPLLHWDREQGLLSGVRRTLSAVLTGSGTIPQSSAYPVYHAQTRTHIGELDEEYVHESRVGDVFQLGTSSYRISAIKGDRLYASEVPANAYSEIPFWRGDGVGRSYALSRKVGELLEELERRAGTEAESATAEWLMAEYRLDEHAAQSLAGHVAAQAGACAVPHHRQIVVEHYEDDVKRHHLVLHTVFGRRTNRTLLLALQRLYEARVDSKLYTYVRDNGIELIFREWRPEYADLWLGLAEERLSETLAESIPSSPLFGVTFRHLAQTSLLLSRGFTRMPLWQQRMRSERLLEESLPYADRFPLIREAMRICLHESLDPERVKNLMSAIRRGDIRVVIHRTSYPSPFAAQFVWEFVNTVLYESDAVSQDIQYRLITVSKQLAGQFFEPAAFQGLMDSAEAQAWLDATYGLPGHGPQSSTVETAGEASLILNAQEPQQSEADVYTNKGQPAARGGHESGAERLYRILKRHGDLTLAEIRTRLGQDHSVEEALEALLIDKRVCETEIGGERRWICADETETYSRFPDEPAAALFVLRRYAERQIAFTAVQLAERYGISENAADVWIASWARDGVIERSPFAASFDEALWTSKSAASRLLRFSIGQMRKRAEPVLPDRYCLMLLERQHISPARRLEGMEGLREAISCLQGHYLPLSHWETFVFPARVTDYRKEWLDLLCASGEVIWHGRKDEGEKEGRIAFYLAESKELHPIADMNEQTEQPTTEPELLALLRDKGASFLTGLSRDTGFAPSVLIEKLLCLVWEGRVSNDQFAPVRLHGRGSSRRGVPASGKGFQSGLGRWYAVRGGEEAAIGTGGAVSSFAGSGNGDTTSTVGRRRGSDHKSAEGAREKAAVAWIHHLLNSYGVITRDVLSRYMPEAGEGLQNTIRKLEDWGMLARGFWIQGVAHMQLATPETVERLRQPIVPSSDTIVLPAADPANPYGVLLQWPERKPASFSRKPGNFLVFHRGRWVLWIEGNGKRFFTIEQGRLSGDEEKEALLAAVGVMLRQPGQRKIVVASWDGIAALQADSAELFRQLGAEADQGSFVLWPSTLNSYK